MPAKFENKVSYPRKSKFPVNTHKLPSIKESNKKLKEAARLDFCINDFVSYGQTVCILGTKLIPKNKTIAFLMVSFNNFI